jgi:hypothetical protein
VEACAGIRKGRVRGEPGGAARPEKRRDRRGRDGNCSNDLSKRRYRLDTFIIPLLSIQVTASCSRRVSLKRRHRRWGCPCSSCITGCHLHGRGCADPCIKSLKSPGVPGHLSCAHHPALHLDAISSSPNTDNMATQQDNWSSEASDSHQPYVD